MKLKIIIVSTICCILITACSHRAMGQKNVIKKSHACFSVDFLPDSWQKKSFRGADLFFKDKSTDSTIFLNAQCEKISDSPLMALTAQMLVGMGKYDIISQKPLPIDGREALITEVNVKLDGVQRYLKIMVLRKNRCVFDAVLSAQAYHDKEVLDFDRLVESFCAEADL